MGRKVPRQYTIELPYGEAHLDLLLFSDVEHRWIFTHNYLKRENEDRFSKPVLTNKTCLVVNYEQGIASGIELSMDIKRPDKRGKVYWLGIDISPGSHLFVEFKYEKQRELFRMKTVQTGVRERIDLDSIAKSNLPMKQFKFPFPIADRVDREAEGYKVPFLKNDGSEGHFVFPENYRR